MRVHEKVQEIQKLGEEGYEKASMGVEVARLYSGDPRLWTAKLAILQGK